MNWKTIDKMVEYLRNLDFDVDNMSIPQIKELYELLIMGGLDNE